MAAPVFSDGDFGIRLKNKLNEAMGFAEGVSADAGAVEQAKAETLAAASQVANDASIAAGAKADAQSAADAAADKASAADLSAQAVSTDRQAVASDRQAVEGAANTVAQRAADVESAAQEAVAAKDAVAQDRDATAADRAAAEAAAAQASKIALGDAIDDEVASPNMVFSSEKVAATVQQVRYDLADPEKGAQIVAYRGRSIQQDLDDREISAARFGLRPGNSASANADAMDLIASELSSYDGAILIPPGRYQLGRMVTLPRHASLNGQGRAAFDAEGIATPFGTADLRAVILKTGADPIQTVGLGAPATRLSKTLVFATAHDLSAGDVGMIYNPADYSWSQWRPSYRAGEFFRVQRVIDAVTVQLSDPLYDSYDPADVEVWKFPDPCSGLIRNIDIIAPGEDNPSVVAAVFRYGGDNLILDRMRCYNSGAVSAKILHCLGSTARDVVGHQIAWPDGITTCYGWQIANSQSIEITGKFTGHRKGIDIGGADYLAIPNRDVSVHNFTASVVLAGRNSAGTHGNAEFCSFSNGSLFGGGVNTGGDNNSFTDLEIHASAATIALGAELLGCNHTFRRVRGSTTLSDPSIAVMDFGFSALAMDAKTVRGGTFRFEKIVMEAPYATRRGLMVRNRGASVDYHVVAEDVEFIAPSAESVSVSSVLYTNAQSGTQAKSVVARNLKPSTNNTALLSASATSAITGQRASGVASISYAAAGTSSAATLTFPFTFAKAPVVTVSFLGTGLVGTKRVVVGVASVAASTASLRIQTADGSEFGVDGSLQVSWSAALDEYSLL
nr:hypothetical protein [Pseudomonas sp.]